MNLFYVSVAILLVFSCFVMTCWYVYSASYFQFFLTIENNIDYISWYSYQYKPTRKSPQSFQFIHSLSPFIFASSYNLIILQPIYGSSWIHTISFCIPHWASSYNLAIKLLYHSKLLSGDSIRCWFRFVARLSRPWFHTPYNIFYNHKI